jgi:hypothetical protein
MLTAKRFLDDSKLESYNEVERGNQKIEQLSEHIPGTSSEMDTNQGTNICGPASNKEADVLKTIARWI